MQQVRAKIEIDNHLEAAIVCKRWRNVRDAIIIMLII